MVPESPAEALQVAATAAVDWLRGPVVVAVPGTLVEVAHLVAALERLSMEQEVEEPELE